MWLMSAAQARQLRARIAAEMDSGLDWVACHRIATDLKLSYTQARPSAETSHIWQIVGMTELLLVLRTPGHGVPTGVGRQTPLNLRSLS